MIDVKLGVSGNQIQRTEELLGHIPGAAAKAIARAMNRTIEGTRTQIVRSVTGDYIIKAKDVRETIRIERASPSKLQARLISAGSVIGLQHFSFSPKTIKPRPKVGVRVRVRKDSKATAISGAFVSDSIQGIFRRKGKDRFPLERLHGPAVPSMITTVLDSRGLQEQAEERFVRELGHEVDWILKKGAK
jgi:hypothetical protein